MLEYHFYKRKNTDETVVLLHGMGGNSKIFYKQMDLYRSRFNVLAIHLPGHGDSPGTHDLSIDFNYDAVVGEVLSVMDSVNLMKTHFIGISLGSIIVHHILQTHPERVKSTTLGGAVTRFNLLAKCVFNFGYAVKGFVPFLWLYVAFAHIMLPKKNHKKSRGIFINEAKKMKREDFLSWFKLIGQVDITYRHVHERSSHIPKLYISGEEDHLFVHKLLIDIEGDQTAEVKLIKQCGHVCNIEKPEEFNAASLHFLERQVESKNVG